MVFHSQDQSISDSPFILGPKSSLDKALTSCSTDNSETSIMIRMPTESGPSIKSQSTSIISFFEGALFTKCLFIIIEPFSRFLEDQSTRNTDIQLLIPDAIQLSNPRAPIWTVNPTDTVSSERSSYQSRLSGVGDEFVV